MLLERKNQWGSQTNSAGAAPQPQPRRLAAGWDSEQTYRPVQSASPMLVKFMELTLSLLTKAYAAKFTM